MSNTRSNKKRRSRQHNGAPTTASNVTSKVEQKPAGQDIHTQTQESPTNNAQTIEPTNSTQTTEPTDSTQTTEPTDSTQAVEPTTPHVPTTEHIVFPEWPTSRPGPLAVAPPPGMRPINAWRREQVTEDI